jgi:hypothetical protein
MEYIIAEPEGYFASMINAQSDPAQSKPETQLAMVQSAIEEDIEGFIRGFKEEIGEVEKRLEESNREFKECVEEVKEGVEEVRRRLEEIKIEISVGKLGVNLGPAQPELQSKIPGDSHNFNQQIAAFDRSLHRAFRDRPIGLGLSLEYKTAVIKCRRAVLAHDYDTFDKAYAELKARIPPKEGALEVEDGTDNGKAGAWQRSTSPFGRCLLRDAPFEN